MAGDEDESSYRGERPDAGSDYGSLTAVTVGAAGAEVKELLSPRLLRYRFN